MRQIRQHRFPVLCAALLLAAAALLTACRDDLPPSQPPVAQTASEQPQAAPAPAEPSQPQAAALQSQAQQEQQQKAEFTPPSPPPRRVDLEHAAVLLATDEVELPVFVEAALSFSLPENADGSQEPISLGFIRIEPYAEPVIFVGGQQIEERGMRSEFWVDRDSGEVFYTGKGIDYESDPDIVLMVSVTPVVPQVWRYRWAPPPLSSEPVTHYEYRWREWVLDRDSNRQITGEWSEIGSTEADWVEIEGLLPGTTYEVVVRAVSAAGTSAWSEAFIGSLFRGTDMSAHTTTLVTIVDVAEPPAAPELTREIMSTVANEVVTIRWPPPTADDRPPVSGYEYRYRAEDGDWEHHLVGLAPRARLQNLSPETSYEFQVRAINAEGPGEWSAVLPYQHGAGWFAGFRQ